ncbi:helix-turn-helix transcriptional regulator [Paeniroseomonas aquatica]|uniref:helix-turn-helix transcriptional regulator n=1 Tax=Paeniroseomonas aquatica TaxID=373043 RepID=UPI00361863D7
MNLLSQMDPHCLPWAAETVSVHGSGSAEARAHRRGLPPRAATAWEAPGMQTSGLARVHDARFLPQPGFEHATLDSRLRPVHVFSTASVPPARQFDAWQAQCGPVLDLGAPPGPAFGYRAHCTAWKLGPFALTSVSAAAARYRRTPAQIRRDAIDHWVIRMARRGTQSLWNETGAAVMAPGIPCIMSLGSAFDGERSDLDWVSLVVPRDLFPSIAPTIDRSLHVGLDGSLGLLLGCYLEMINAQLGTMTEAELPRLVAATRAMVAACIAPAPGIREAAAPLLNHTRMERVRQAIRHNLRSPTLTPKRICRLVGMSRSQLYRLFEPIGGVARYIQAERLREAHRALANPDNQRGIHEVAEDLGFFDASAFSRIFRREYGCTPSEVRSAAVAGLSDASPQRSPRPRGAVAVASLTDLLQLQLRP